MKIVFICSALEPGRDGVGDYTRRLAGELIRRGDDVVIFSLNDRYVDNVLSGLQCAEGTDVPVVRIPSGYSIKQRFLLAKEQIDQIGPDWLSLQYVPFGFHPKGLHAGLSKRLSSLGKGRRWHIMFHELWVGMALEESKKLVWWGRGQRYFIKSLLNNLRPSVVHTQTRLYQAQIAKLGFNADYLPLFGNIPVNSPTGKNGKAFVSEKISFVIFGSIHDGAPIDEFAKEAAKYSREKGVVISFTFVGRCGPERDRWSAILRSEALSVEFHGEESAIRISDILSNSTMGISATALAVIEKSGSFAAMREHGLTVICVSKPWQPAGIPKLELPAGIVEYKIGNFEECISCNRHVPFNNSVIDVADKFRDTIVNTSRLTL